jgi:hypothetical protein
VQPAAFSHKIGYKSIFIIISIIIVGLIIDTSIIKISVFTGGLGSNGSDIALFSVMVIVFGMGQYFILHLTKRKYHENPISHNLKVQTINKIVVLTQYALLAILAFIIVQMVFTTSYNTLGLLAVIWITYILSIVTLGFLCQLFFSWFKSNRNLVVLVYALAVLLLSTNAVFALAYMTFGLTYAPSDIRPVKSLLGFLGIPGSILSPLYVITSILSFIFMWFATVLLLKHYSRRLGKVKYWITVAIPLVYFLSQFQTVFINVLAPFRLADPVLFGVLYTLIFSATKPAGGVLFGIAFWGVAKNISNSAVKNYMFISAYGMMLLFTANQPIGLLLYPYPPFGLATISFMGLASYLILVGVYSAAISVAQDSSLRQSIRKITIKESRFLDTIGVAQMEQEINKKVLAMAKSSEDIMTKETGVSTSLESKDVAAYINQVLEEIKNKRER